MVSLPRTCKHCGEKMLHYSSCRCPQAQLDSIEYERRAIVLRLARLDEREAEERQRLASVPPT